MKAVNWPAPGQRAAGCSRVARLDHLAGLVSLALSLVLIACAFPQPKILGTAIVFGASDYTLFKDLPATMADAIAMDALLTEQGWDSRLIVNTEATAARLKAELASLTGNTQPVLFYYAGHGYIEPEETFLVPVDASPFVDNLRPNLISSRDLHGWLVEYDIRHPILILDSCYSGGFAPGGVAYDGIPADYNPWVTPSEDTPAFSQVGALLAGAFQAWLGADNGSGAVVLAAAGPPELSWEENTASSLPYAGHGIFTWFLLAAATDPLADRDGDGFVSTVEAYLYTRTKLDEEWNKLHSRSSDPELVYLPRQSGGLRDYLLFSQP